MKRTSLLLLFVLIASILVGQSKSEYLKEVLNNLGKIKSATYFSTKTTYQQGDTISMFGDKHFYFKWFDNPADTSVGASFVKLYQDDTTRMQFAYDGNVRVLVYDEDKTLVIDNFEYNYWPFRIVYPPFITMAKNIIKFVNETKDSVLIESKDFGQQIQFIVSIFDHQVHFVGKIPVYETPYGSKIGENSLYEIWVNKSNGLPFKIVQDMLHEKTVEVVEFIILNEHKIENFKVSDYFMPDYKLREYKIAKSVTKNEFEGKTAPEWLLKDADNTLIDFKDLKSKVVLIQFTGIGCGHCQMAIPFLKQLFTENKDKDFELVSIETWVSSLDGIKKYRDKHKIDYMYLQATEKVKSDYKINSAPIFFILDENRIIRKVINGYGKGTTDKEIRDTINKLI
ncbi:MAG: TlpA family protein disulfide reductase [Bacteroidetes bacterium]|nr:TlpA family protein disulfide reductase [Bacteroidota bacterium]